MINLVKNELYKIMHKKGTIITLIIFSFLVVFVTIIYAHTSIYPQVTYGDEDNIIRLEQEINNFDFDHHSLSEYASLNADLETEKYILAKTDSWLVEKYYTYVADLVYKYYDLYYCQKDLKQAQKVRDDINNLLEKLAHNDWPYFVKLEIEKIEQNIAWTQEDPNAVDYLSNLEVYKYQKYLREYRLQNNISYENSYLNDALNELDYLVNEKIAYEFTKREEYQEAYAKFKENEYILENKIDTKNEQSLRGIIHNFFAEYLFLILLFIIMIAGSMVSNEFSKGTIKTLLTIPYTRGQILLAKYITILLMIPFIIIFLLFWQIIIGGIIFGFDTLAIPIIGYNFNLNMVEVMSLAKYFLLIFLAKLPMIILLATLAFSLSTILLSTSFALIISLGGYFASSLINSLALHFKSKFLTYFVTLNWDLEYNLFGGISPYGISLKKSILICGLYLVIMLSITFYIFKKRNVKNI